MIGNSRVFFVLAVVLWAQSLSAAIQGGIETKSTHYDNFNLAYGGAEPISEDTSSLDVSLTVFTASSRDFVWLLKGTYNYTEYDRYTYLSGSSASLLGGMFYRFDLENSLTLELGKRERRYDNQALSLYEDDAWLANLKLSHRLSSTTLLNEKVSYEENVTGLASNQYQFASAQLWLEWSLGGRSGLSIGYTFSKRSYKNSDAEYSFEEPYVNYSYSITKNLYTRIGFSKVKVVNQASDRAYNETAYLALGIGF